MGSARRTVCRSCQGLRVQLAFRADEDIFALTDEKLTILVPTLGTEYNGPGFFQNMFTGHTHEHGAGRDLAMTRFYRFFRTHENKIFWASRTTLISMASREARP